MERISPSGRSDVPQRRVVLNALALVIAGTNRYQYT